MQPCPFKLLTLLMLVPAKHNSMHMADLNVIDLSKLYEELTYNMLAFGVEQEMKRKRKRKRSGINKLTTKCYNRS